MKITSVKVLNSNEDLLKADRNREASVIEIGDKSIVFEVPSVPQKFYARLLISGVVHLKSGTREFQCIGNIISNESLDQVSRLGVDLLQYDKDLWVQFLQMKSERQDRADYILRSIKGES